MSDTQWPRFMVFVKESKKDPWRHYGTVHAPDSEMALLNARDVFARRPQALGMWVVPADSIFTKTREELSSPVWAQHAAPTAQQSYFIFAKPFEQAACELLGELEANSPQAALKSALETYADKNPLWWWVFPSSTVLASENADTDPMFAPALEKTYKNQSEYHTVTMMRQLHDKGKLES